MSTFNGILSEFPGVQIDYFRTQPDHPPPLVCFLSHVHSDHLQGLESLKAPFVYCSAVTKEVLIRLEKYPHRMNFAKGILESRVQTYRHLKSILKAVPLEAPTVVELSPGNEIRVTLFDANHCIGAVMFLIQAHNKAILYTGDIRAESWWVNSLVQNPILLPYTLGPLRLDKIYLDTTFAKKSDVYRTFPSKAEGIRELLEKVDRYPKDTTFYIEAWTFGYENVWLALSNYLNSAVHLDRYRWNIYRSLASTHDSLYRPGGPALSGFILGNHDRSGCLTPDHKVLLHSCEKGAGCPVIGRQSKYVRIVPIVTRLLNGDELHELGIGGGHGDLDQVHELEITDAATLTRLFQLCAARIEDAKDLDNVRQKLCSAFEEDKMRLRIAFLQEQAATDGQDMSIDQLVASLIKSVQKAAPQPVNEPFQRSSRPSAPPSTITFPFSRHSSYSELCNLVEAFKPKDVYPCTVDETRWNPTLSMRTLFGHLCSANVFEHDQEMLAKLNTSSSTTSGHLSKGEWALSQSKCTDCPRNPNGDHTQKSSRVDHESVKHSCSQDRGTRELDDVTIDLANAEPAGCEHTVSTDNQGYRTLQRDIRQWAYHAVAGSSEHCGTWDIFGGLTCVKKLEREADL